MNERLSKHAVRELMSCVLFVTFTLIVVHSFNIFSI